jgi:predicted RNA binding protein YcfA (HicA-like mRNA interferase family)
MKFSELVRILEKDGFHLIKEKGSIRYYSKPGNQKLIRVDFMAQKKSLKEHVMLF